jgi:acetyl esterase/lipase
MTVIRQYVGEHDPRAPYISPLYADLHGLPPLRIQVGGSDILLNDSTRLAECARAAGLDVTLEIWPDMWHGRC